MLRFIYTDKLSEDEEPTTSTCDSVASIAEKLTVKLLAAADRYGLDRLGLLCEARLCNDISIKSVARMLALADRYHAKELKAVCLKFAAANLAGVYTTYFAFSVVMNIIIAYQCYIAVRYTFFLLSLC